ncbi:hypothetical protein QG37_07537 [Candidozyma auris]|nr:hypothetical protein QG37_07537 [[Candida] auris]
MARLNRRLNEVVEGSQNASFWSRDGFPCSQDAPLQHCLQRGQTRQIVAINPPKWLNIALLEMSRLKKYNHVSFLISFLETKPKMAKIMPISTSRPRLCRRLCRICKTTTARHISKGNLGGKRGTNQWQISFTGTFGCSAAHGRELFVDANERHYFAV